MRPGGRTTARRPPTGFSTRSALPARRERHPPAARPAFGDHRRREPKRADRGSGRPAVDSDCWKVIGIKMVAKPQTRENFRLRTFSGEALMTAYAGSSPPCRHRTPAPGSSPRRCAAACNGRNGECSPSPAADRARSATWSRPADRWITSRNGEMRVTTKAAVRRGRRSCRSIPTRSSRSGR